MTSELKPLGTVTSAWNTRRSPAQCDELVQYSNISDWDDIPCEYIKEDVDAPEKIWIEQDDCPYYYEESELAEVGSPVTEYIRSDLCQIGKTNTGGVPLRDYFAAKAMVAIILADGIAYVNKTVEHAKLAYEQADAMLAERNRAALAQEVSDD